MTGSWSAPAGRTVCRTSRDPVGLRSARRPRARSLLDPRKYSPRARPSFVAKRFVGIVHHVTQLTDITYSEPWPPDAPAPCVPGVRISPQWRVSAGDNGGTRSPQVRGSL